MMSSMGIGMMLVAGLFWLLVILAIAALIKYLRQK
jgi:hypothetical protein